MPSIQNLKARGLKKEKKLMTDSLVEEDVFGGGDEPLGATEDVRDLHEVVVHDAGQMVRGKAVLSTVWPPRKLVPRYAQL